jgi:hypothetical protein
MTVVSVCGSLQTATEGLSASRREMIAPEFPDTSGGPATDATSSPVLSLAATKVDREIGGDAIEPSRKARTRFELGKVLVGANEGFLGQLNRIIV